MRELELRASGTDLSGAEINHIVKVHASDAEEQPTFIAERLKELRILIPSDQSAQYFLMAEPVRAIAPGQSGVLYDANERLLGGGVIV